MRFEPLGASDLFSRERPFNHDNTMTIEEQNFASRLASSTETHADWLAVMNFGMGTLINEPAMLAELLCAEAIRVAEKTPTHNAADELPGIMKELGLRFVIG